MTTIEGFIYLASLLMTYFYTEKRDSFGFFWAVTFFIGQIILDKLGVALIPSSVGMVIFLLVLFEATNFFNKDPFSSVAVVDYIDHFTEYLRKFLHFVGIHPKTTFIDFEQHPDVIAISEQLKTKNWSAAEEKFAALNANQRHTVISTLTDIKKYTSLFEQWVVARPEHYLPYTFLASNLINEAWHARGSGTADAVSEKGWTIFFAKLNEAKRHLDYVIKYFKPACAEPYLCLITIDMGMGAGGNSHQYFKAAIKISPDHFEIYSKMVHANTAKWGGSLEKTLKIGRDALSQATTGSALTAILAEAHIEQWLYLNMMAEDDGDDEAEQYFQSNAVRQDILDAYEAFGDAEITLDEQIEAMNIFAFCFYKGGWYNKAKECIERAKYQFVKYPWEYAFEAPFMNLIDTGYEVDAVLRKMNMAIKTPVKNDIYRPPTQASESRTFTPSAFVPMTVLMVLGIYAGYAYYHFMIGDEIGSEYLQGISFMAFVIFDIGFLLLLFYNKKLLDGFMRRYPVIDSREALNAIKPVIRLAMYSGLMGIFLLATLALTAAINMFNGLMLEHIIIALLFFLTSGIIAWYSSSEESMKQIICTDDDLEAELQPILDCWMTKALPNF